MPSVAAVTSPPESSSARDAALAELVEGYLARLQAGEAINPSVFAAEHPEHAERLARLLPALELMDDLRRSSIHPGSGLSLTPVLMETPGIAPGLLGDFQIIREVGRGGMGVVYEARQISLDRRVALKVLPMAAAMDPRQLQRFQLEAKAAACLHHTNIVPVHAVGCERGVHYYAMQFIEGQTLAAIIGELRVLEGPDEAEPAQAKDSSLNLASRLAGGELAPAEPAPPAAASKTPSGALRLGAGLPTPPAAGPKVSRSGRTGRDGETFGRDGGGDPSGARRPAPNGRDEEPGDLAPAEPAPPAAAGQSVTGALSSTPTHSRAFFRTVADLGIQAAEAIEHAHGLGVVHRDIKPANILIDHRGTLWITDFGLARLRNDSGLTMTGELMGTLRYMSPEQAMGRPVDIDHRTDIYSLAVTLYELMTRKPAIAGQDRQEVLRRIAHDEPTPPRRLEPAIPRELETIVLKAMGKEPMSRYSTAREMADDLRRFLEHKPIRAKAPSLVERVAKWSRRHRAMVTTCFLFLAVAVVMLATSTILIERQRREAERQRDEARQAVDDMYTDVAQEWLAQKAAMQPVQRKFLQKALNYYERFAEQWGNDPKVRLKAAVAYARVALIHEALGRYPESEAAHRRCLTVLGELVAGEPRVPEYRRHLANVQRQLSRLLWLLGRPGEGERLLRGAIESGEVLAMGQSSVPRDRYELAANQGTLAVILMRTGRLIQAEPLLREAIALLERLAEESPSMAEYRNDLAGQYMNLGSLVTDSGRPSEGEQAYGRGIALFESLVEEFPSAVGYQHSLADCLNNLGELMKQTGRRMDAERIYRRAIALLEKLAAGSPNMRDRHSLAAAHHNLGALLRAEGRRTEAERECRTAVAMHEKLLADSPSSEEARRGLAGTLIEMGGLLLDAGRWNEAESTSRRAISLLQQAADGSASVAEHHYYLAVGESILGRAMRKAGRTREAEGALGRAIVTLEHLASDSPAVAEYRSDLARSQMELGDLLTRTGRPAEAEPPLRRAIELAEGLAAGLPSAPEFRGRLASSNAYLAAAGRAGEAAPPLRRAIDLAEESDVAEAENEVARVLATISSADLRNPQLALRLARKAVEHRPQAGDYWRTLALANLRIGDWKAAIEAVEKAMQLSDGGSPQDRLSLAAAHWRRGDRDEGRSWYDKAAWRIKEGAPQDEEVHRFRGEVAALLGVTRPPQSTGKREGGQSQPSRP